MRLKKRSSQSAAVGRPTRKAGSGMFEAENELIGAARVQADPAGRMSEPAGKPEASAQPKLIRRQDYADVYQMGRRLSGEKNPQSSASTHKKASAGTAGAAGNAVLSLRVPARRLRVQPRFFVIVAGAALLTAAVLAGLAIFKPQAALAQGQEVFFNGRMLCIAASQSDAETALQKIEADLKTTYGMDIQAGADLSFVPVSCDSQNILNEPGIEKALKDNVEAKVVASVITVNDRPAVALKTPEEAQQALDTILAPFQSAQADQNRTDVSFVENVQVRQMPIDYALVQPVDAAVHALTLGANLEDNLYEVQKGDSLGKIAKKFDLMISDIRKANPFIAATDVIRPGDTLNAVKPANWVNVRYTETVTRQEALPFETIEQQSDTMYTTQKKVTQEGKAGQREVTAKVTYINGTEALKEILNQTVLSAAQNEIVLRGTKKVPTNAGSSGTTVSGGFMAPLKDYTITSVFGTRTLEGVTKTHYGIDMAAPKGTPIYATKAGTVDYAGSASGYGLVIYLNNGGGVQTRYGHCSKLLVKKGQHVDKGQIIALVGSTGHSTGPHCHFEMRVNGTPVDPRKHVKL